jgi:adenylate cyclase
LSDFTEVPLLIAFADLERFALQAERISNTEIATVLNAYYELSGSIIREAGGTVVKFMGDAILIAFPAEQIDRGILGLVALRDAADRLMKDCAWDCRLEIKAHYGPVIAGHFGAGVEGRYDILGKAVNGAARLAAGGITLSADAFRSLGLELRSRFTEHTAPNTYVLVENHQRVH